MKDQNFKNLSLKLFYFCEILKMCEKILLSPQIIFTFFTVQREDTHRKSHNQKLKYKMGAKRPKSLVYYKNYQNIHYTM